MSKVHVYTSSKNPFPPTLPALIRSAGSDFAEREFLVLGTERLTYGQAERRSADLARGLLAMGLGKGARVGILMANSPDWVTTFMATSRIGALSVLVSTFYQAPELEWCLRHNDVDTLIVQAQYLKADYLERLERALPGLARQKGPELYLPSHPYLRRIIVWGECDRPWAMKGPKAVLAAMAERPEINDAFLAAIETNIAPSDWLLTICTSGSTAEPKAVVHAHSSALLSSFAFVSFIDMRPNDRAYTGQAFFWVGGLALNLFPAMFVGACLVFSETPQTEEIVRVVEREKITRVSMWLSQLSSLQEAADRLGCNLSSIRGGLAKPVDFNGDEIPPDRRLGGVLGMTESFGMHSIDYRFLPTPPGKGGHWGRALPGIERKVVDRENGRELPPGQEGELYIRGHTLMQGYYRRDRDEAFTSDGFFATGDLAILDDDGFMYFQGRASEMIKTSGANVSPREVELAIQRDPAVREAIVFGQPDPIRGEIVVAVVVPADGVSIDPDTLKEKLRSEVSPYKVPASIVVMPHDRVPRTGSDKPKKADLREMITRENASRE